MYSIRSIMLPSLILLINEYPAPLSVIVRPKASSLFSISISFGRPKTKNIFKRKKLEQNYRVNFLLIFCLLKYFEREKEEFKLKI